MSIKLQAEINALKKQVAELEENFSQLFSAIEELKKPKKAPKKK